MKLPCIICDKVLEIIKDDIGSRMVQGGVFLDFDIDEGSRFHNRNHRIMLLLRGWAESVFAKLILSDHINAVMCDECFEKKHKSCYGTTIEIKKTVTHVFPGGTDT